MRVLFSSTWGYGHVFPMVPLARAFRDAGHDVLWATNEPACGQVAAAGLAVAPAGLGTQGVAEVENGCGPKPRSCVRRTVLASHSPTCSANG